MKSSKHKQQELNKDVEKECLINDKYICKSSGLMIIVSSVLFVL